MAFLTIDKTKCKQDGICAAECPRRIITQEDDKSFPQISKADEAICMACGHCVAVCPYGALSLARVNIEDGPEIKKELILSWSQAEQFLRSRRSIPSVFFLNQIYFQ
ncbi:MAG: 4Fe-4S binding protein [Desulfobacterales bacterium]|nr:4Fe-4S binding protein [Desulfobacterales bacterium]